VEQRLPQPAVVVAAALLAGAASVAAATHGVARSLAGRAPPLPASFDFSSLLLTRWPERGRRAADNDRCEDEPSSRWNGPE
jgi:hypothetical protein